MFFTLRSTQNSGNAHIVRRVEINVRNTPDGKGITVFGDVDYLSKIMLVLAMTNTDPTSRCDWKVGFLDLELEQRSHFVDRNEIHSSRKIHAYETITGLVNLSWIACLNVYHTWKRFTLKGRDY